MEQKIGNCCFKSGLVEPGLCQTEFKPDLYKFASNITNRLQAVPKLLNCYTGCVKKTSNCPGTDCSAVRREFYFCL